MSLCADCCGHRCPPPPRPPVPRPQSDLGVTLDAARPDKDAKRPSANAEVVIKGTEENVLRAKPLITAMAKGASAQSLPLCCPLIPHRTHA